MTTRSDAGGIDGPEPGFDKLIAKVKADFVESLLQRTIDLENVRVLLDRDGATAGGLSKVAEIAHKLAGVAPSFGFHAMGETALSIDRELQKPNPSSDMQAAWHRNRDQVEHLLNLMEDAMDGAV
ncbi:MAG: Hpt domain-containing protein [Jhaorihella sp.]